MIKIFHGDDIVRSRNAFLEYKQSFKDSECIVFDGKTIKLDELIQAGSAKSLFSENTVIAIDNGLSSLTKKPKQLENFSYILIELAKTAEIMLWEEKEMSKTVLSRFGKSMTESVFKIRTKVFDYLDGIVPSQAGKSLERLDSLIHEEAIELLWVMTLRRFRQLLLCKIGKPPAKLQPWQVSRLTIQAKAYTLDQLYSLYRSILVRDYSMKTGRLEGSLELNLYKVIAKVSFPVEQSA